MRTAVDVHNYLVERDVPHELVPTQGRVRAPERVAAVLGLEPEQVGRVRLFETMNGGVVAALVPAGHDPDPERVRAAGGGEVTELEDERATDLTQFLPEAMPPVALPEDTTTILDERLAAQEVLYFPGGEATSLLKIRPEDLLAATEARVAPLTS
ncbi:MAG TPA: YbaK/EbsC family protein [Actinomycetota bacterium]|nr:YbaK/EbsC family protein [Actinomycetota bacterium]